MEVHSTLLTLPCRNSCCRRIKRTVWFTKIQSLFADAVREHLTSEDVVAIAYRKRQIDVFEKLLTDKAYFNAKKLERNASGDEALWQMFFEKKR